MIPQLTKKASRPRLTPPVGRLESDVHQRITLLELRSGSIILVQEDSMIDDLYDLIGGRQTIWAATESFYRRVLADGRVSHFFESTDMAHLRARQSMFISMLLGGQIVYTGKDITGAHVAAREQGLNDTHFDLFLKHFREALEEVGVKADKSEKVMKLLESKRNAVLNR
jgi:hemoglobin